MGTLVIGGTIALGLVRLRTRLDETQQIETQEETELREEFVHQSRLAESYETILDAVPEPLLVLRRDRRVLHANRAIVDLLGHDPIDADLVAAVRHPDVIAAAATVLAGEAAERTVEFQRGGVMEQTMVARLVGLPNGRADGPAAVLALHDLTLIRKATEMRTDQMQRWRLQWQQRRW